MQAGKARDILSLAIIIGLLAGIAVPRFVLGEREPLLTWNYGMFSVTAQDEEKELSVTLWGVMARCEERNESYMARRSWWYPDSAMVWKDSMVVNHGVEPESWTPGPGWDLLRPGGEEDEVQAPLHP